MIRLHVLLVDDETDTRQTVEAALALDPFFTVRDCASGVEALTAAVAWTVPRSWRGCAPTSARHRSPSYS